VTKIKIEKAVVSQRKGCGESVTSFVHLLFTTSQVTCHVVVAPVAVQLVAARLLLLAGASCLLSPRVLLLLLLLLLLVVVVLSEYLHGRWWCPHCAGTCCCCCCCCCCYCYC
jgi:hypothetical protein